MHPLIKQAIDIWIKEASEYILSVNRWCEDHNDIWDKPSNNLIIGAEKVMEDYA